MASQGIGGRDEGCDVERPASEVTTSDVISKLPWTEIPALPERKDWPQSSSTSYKHYHPGMLLFESGPVGSLGVKQSPTDKIRVGLFMGKKQYQDSVFGIMFYFLRKQPEGLTQVPTLQVRATLPYNVLISLPPGGFKLHSRPSVVADHEGPVSELLIQLNVDAKIDVHGYGMPFKGLDEDIDGWINENRSIQGSATLLDILRATEFTVVTPVDIPALHGFLDFSKMSRGEYPYNYSLNFQPIALYRAVERAHGPMFPTATHFSDDKMLFTVLSQTVIQDYIHLHQDAEKIKSLEFAAHLFESEDPNDSRTTRQYAVVYCEEHKEVLQSGTMPSSWIRLLSDQDFKVSITTIHLQGRKAKTGFYRAKSVTDDGVFEASLPDIVIEFKEPLRVARSAFVDKATLGWDGPDTVGLVRINLLFQSDKVQAERKLDALKLSVLDTSPLRPENITSNAQRSGGRHPQRKRQRASESVSSVIPQIPSEDYRVQKRLQSFIGDFWQGRGFWRSCSQVPPPLEGYAPSESSTGHQPLLQSLSQHETLRADRRLIRPPRVSLVDAENSELLSAITHAVLPKDRERFQRYMNTALLGIAVITGFAGSGKTEVLAATVTAMTFKKATRRVYASSSSNIGVDELATRIGEVSRSAVDLYNRAVGKTRQVKHIHVVRGHNKFSEVDQFIDYILFGRGTNWTDTKPDPKGLSPLSGAQWLAHLFRGQFSENDPEVLQTISDNIGGRFDDLRYLSEKDFASRQRLINDDRQQLREPLLTVLDEIILGADVVCTTPAMAGNEPYASYNRQARAVAFDNANSLSRVDAIMLWGNTGRPCVMAGDPKLTGPTIKMTDRREQPWEADSDDGWFPSRPAKHWYPYNRMADEASVSLLDWTRQLGWDELVLDTQMRMSQGLFDLMRQDFYSEFCPEPGYHPLTALHNRPLTRRIDSLLRRKYDISVDDQVARAVFVHCDKAVPLENPRTLSKFNTGQLAIIMGLLQDLLTACVEPEDVVILTPYTANISVLRKMTRKHPKLSEVLITTVDKYQGKQAEVVIYVFTVTTNAHATFAANPQRLNAAMSRARSALILVGNLGLSRDNSVLLYHAEPKKDGEKGEMVVRLNSRDKRNREQHVELELLTSIIGSLCDARRIIKETYQPVESNKERKAHGVAGLKA